MESFIYCGWIENVIISRSERKNMFFIDDIHYSAQKKAKTKFQYHFHINLAVAVVKYPWT